MLGVRSLRNQCERSAISSSVLGIGEGRPRSELSLRPEARALLGPRASGPDILGALFCRGLLAIDVNGRVQANTMNRSTMFDHCHLINRPITHAAINMTTPSMASLSMAYAHMAVQTQLQESAQAGQVNDSCECHSSG